MSTTTFVNAKAVKWYTLDGQAVFLGKTRIWPPSATSHQLGNDPYTETNEEVTLFVGDTIHLEAGHGADWLDALPGILRLENGVQKGEFTPGPKGWTLQPVALPDGSNGKAYVSNSRSADLDTAGMSPGTYQILAPVFYDFNSCKVLLTIHLLPLPGAPVLYTPTQKEEEILAKRLSDLNVYMSLNHTYPQPTFNLGPGDTFAIPGFFHLADDVSVKAIGVVDAEWPPAQMVGSADAYYTPHGDGSIMAEFGGHWKLPTTPGTYWLSIGPDGGNLFFPLAKIVIS